GSEPRPRAREIARDPVLAQAQRFAALAMRGGHPPGLEPLGLPFSHAGSAFAVLAYVRPSSSPVVSQAEPGASTAGDRHASSAEIHACALTCAQTLPTLRAHVSTRSKSSGRCVATADKSKGKTRSPSPARSP